MELGLQAVDAGPQPGRDVLHTLDLHIGSGELVAIIGPSGAGKTTLLHVLGLALAPAAGRVLQDGTDPWRLSPAQRQRWRAGVFLAPQAPPLPPRQRVVNAVQAGRLASLGLWASLLALFHASDPEPIALALQRFDLADKLFERVDRLSGGERQRVGLARGLVSPARLWLIDEPLSSLDPVRARQAVQTLTACARERGVTLVVSFHQVDVALEFFPRILGLREGRVLFDRPSADVRSAELAALYANEGLPQAPMRGAQDKGASCCSSVGTSSLTVG